MIPSNYHLIWDPAAVLISFGICYLGSSIGLNLAEQYRLTSKENSPKLYNKTILGLAQAMGQGAVGIFTVQIIGTNAISLTDSDGQIVNNRYRLDFLLVSLVVVTLCCMIGLNLCVRDEVYAMNKVETLEIYIRDSNNITIGEMKKKKNRNSVVFRTLFKGVSSLLVGGVLYGVALIIGSYLSVTSLIIDECTIEWNVGPFVAVIIVILGACSLCCWIVFRLLALYPFVESLRFACSVLIAISICGVHYLFIGAAVTFVHVPGKPFTPPYPSFMTFSQYQVYLGVTVGSIIYSCMVLIVALSDTRFWFYRLSKSSRIIDEMIMNMDKRLNSIESSSNSDENALDFKKECKDFMIVYKSFIGTTNTLDIKTQLDKKIKSRSASHPRISPNIPQSAHGRVREVASLHNSVRIKNSGSKDQTVSKEQLLPREFFVSAV